MQTGSFDNISRCMIEMGIPRETAIDLFDTNFAQEQNFTENKLEIEEMIRSRIGKKFNDLPYWEQVQLKFLK